jgi:hypothetical protein
LTPPAASGTMSPGGLEGARLDAVTGPDEPTRPDLDEALNLREEWGADEDTDATSGVAVAGTPTAPQAVLQTQHLPRVERTGREKVQGIARGVDQRVSDAGPILTFRLEGYDVSGNRLPPVPVAVRRYREGLVTDGDEVEVHGKWSHGTLRATRVVNLTTASEVRTWFPNGVKWLLLPLLFAFVVVAAIIVIFVLTHHTAAATVRVPNVVGKDQTLAFDAIRSAGLLPDGQPEANALLPRGTVVRTNPPAGFPANKHDTVIVVVSLGPPSTAGRDPITTAPPATSPPATQSPVTQPPATQPAATSPPTQPPTTVAVPGVDGKSQAAATSELQSLGFQVVSTTENDGNTPQGDVIRTNPGAGTMLPKGSTVTLVVSSGAPPAQP